MSEHLDQIRQALSEWRGQQRDELLDALRELLDTCEARHVDLSVRDDGHPAWCELASDHLNRCHTAGCGYNWKHDGLCWHVPTWPEMGDARLVPNPYVRGRALDIKP